MPTSPISIYPYRLTPLKQWPLDHKSLDNTTRCHLDMGTPVGKYPGSEFQLPPKKQLPDLTHLSSPKTPFSFMLLPDEIKLHIMAYVKINSPDTFLVLQLVHPWFKASIWDAEILQASLLSAEMKASELARLFTNTLTCFTCLETLPSTVFAPESRIPPMHLGGPDAHRRRCIDCEERLGPINRLTVCVS
ncbi:MAG: hypothetical protein Q9168_004944 [Polycauliona sp. 1 TL-2023]